LQRLLARAHGAFEGFAPVQYAYISRQLVASAEPDCKVLMAAVTRI
jgi:hypothetical protein